MSSAVCQTVCDCATLNIPELDVCTGVWTLRDCKSTAVSIVHEGVTALLQHLVPVPASIKFPTGAELEEVVFHLELLSGLPTCAGAID